MESRERILLVVFLGLVVLGGFYYSNVILDPIKGLLGYGSSPNKSRTPDKSPSERSVEPSTYLNSGLSYYRSQLVERFDNTDLDFDRTDESYGVSGDFRVSLESSDTPLRNNTSVKGTFSGKIFADVSIFGTINFDTPADLRSSEWSVQTGKEALFLSNEKIGKYQIKRPMIVSNPPFGMNLSRFSDSGIESLEETNWKGRDVVRLKLESSGEREIIITREKPYKLLMLTYANGNRWSRRFRYSSDEIESITTLRQGDTVSQWNFNDGEVTYLVDSESGQLQRVRASVRNQNGEISVSFDSKATEVSGFQSLGSATVNLSEGLPDRMSAELRFNSDRSSISLESNEVNLVKNESQLSNFEQEEHKTVDFSTLLQKITETKESGTTKANESDSERSGSETTSQRATSVERESESTANTGQSKVKSEYRNVEAPPNSGETIRFTEEGYPSAVPPDGFKSARELYEQGKPSAALKRLKTLSDSYPASANVNYMMGLIKFQQGRYSEARRHFERVLETKHDPQLRSWSQHYLRTMADPSDGNKSTGNLSKSDTAS